MISVGGAGFLDPLAAFLGKVASGAVPEGDPPFPLRDPEDVFWGEMPKADNVRA
jgi:hypothetical protein